MTGHIHDWWRIGGSRKEFYFQCYSGCGAIFRKLRYTPGWSQTQR